MVRHYKSTPGRRTNLNYTSSARENAVRDVKSKKLSVREASEKYQLPAMTISRHVRGLNQGSYGGQTALSTEGEARLVKMLNICAEWSQLLQYYDVCLVVQGYLDKSGLTEKRFKENLPGRDWFYNFLKRNKELTMKICENVKRVRAGLTHEAMNKYFDNLEESLEGVGPANIINYDETNFCDDAGKVKVIVKKGVKHADRMMDTSKTSTSVMMSITASGHVFPPYVVYKAKHIHDGWIEGGWPGACYNRSSSGWFDLVTFEDWFMEIIVPYCRKRPGKKVLIGDNLASDLSLAVFEMCEKLDILFVLLLPNSTHLCQHLDVAFFRALKRAWRKILEMWKLKHRGVLPKTEFPRLLKAALDLTGLEKLSESAVSGFKATEIERA